MKIGMLTFIAVVAFAAIFIVPAFIKWKQQQKELKAKMLHRLSIRGDRLLNCLDIVSDRYLAKDTKIFFYEYVLSVITQLSVARYQSEFVTKQAIVLEALGDLKLGQQVNLKDKVSSQEQLDHIQNALQFMLRELRNMGESYGVSRVIVRHHIMLVRYAHSLAYSDLLIRQARDDLDNDRKNRALEKYRVALSVIEKSGSVPGSKREIVRLQNMIKDVENVLFSKGNEVKSR